MYHFEQALLDKREPLTFYENTKKNAVASKITETAAATLQESINTKYLETVFKVVFDETGSVSDQLAADGEVSVDSIISQLESFRNTLDSYDRSIDAFLGNSSALKRSISSAKSNLEAQIIAKKIVGSNLVKTAVYGTDANWGRIVVAIGDSMAAVTPEKVEIRLGGQCLFKNNEPQPFSEELAKTYLENSEVKIEVFMQEGEGKGTAWGCDLTYEYVKINASYRT